MHKNDKDFPVTATDSVQYKQKRDTPIFVWTGFTKNDNASLGELYALEQQLSDAAKWAGACTNTSAQLSLALPMHMYTPKGVIIPYNIRKPWIGYITVKDGIAIVPALIILDNNPDTGTAQVLLGRVLAAVKKAIEILSK